MENGLQLSPLATTLKDTSTSGVFSFWTQKSFLSDNGFWICDDWQCSLVEPLQTQIFSGNTSSCSSSELDDTGTPSVPSLGSLMETWMSTRCRTDPTKLYSVPYPLLLTGSCWMTGTPWMQVSCHFCICPNASFGEDWPEQKGMKTPPRSFCP